LQQYIGRFAPSPTGPLHLGSLYTAIASYLQARSRQGKWLLRIDDLDSFRIIPQATDRILKTLELYGLYWDESIFYQSQNLALYTDAIQQLEHLDKTYPCVCTRKQLAKLRSNNAATSIYPRYCRNQNIDPSTAYALRIKTDNTLISFQDALQGSIAQVMDSEHGDFIIQRKDRIIAYQLAVTVDDHYQQITEVVRGYDLLDSTAKQIHLQHQLGYATPDYLHVPVITDKTGCKLSKQSFAQAAPKKHPEAILFRLLSLLKQHPPIELEHASVQELLNWAICNWNPDTLKKTRAIKLEI
jgi:glutamyl-Q tRNA(Asp) synthetase